MKPYLNRHAYSDVYPYKVVKVVSEKTVEVQRMDATLAPDWKPEMVPGGFSAHCTNQATQKWDYREDPDAPTARVRKHKDGKWRDRSGHEYRPCEWPIRFHDYNF